MVNRRLEWATGASLLTRAESLLVVRPSHSKFPSMSLILSQTVSIMYCGVEVPVGGGQGHSVRAAFLQHRIVLARNLSQCANKNNIRKPVKARELKAMHGNLS